MKNYAHKMKAISDRKNEKHYEMEDILGKNAWILYKIEEEAKKGNYEVWKDIPYKENESVEETFQKDFKEPFESLGFDVYFFHDYLYGDFAIIRWE